MWSCRATKRLSDGDSRLETEGLDRHSWGLLDVVWLGLDLTWAASLVGAPVVYYVCAIEERARSVGT